MCVTTMRLLALQCEATSQHTQQCNALHSKPVSCYRRTHTVSGATAPLSARTMPVTSHSDVSKPHARRALQTQRTRLACRSMTDKSDSRPYLAVPSTNVAQSSMRWFCVRFISSWIHHCAGTSLVPTRCRFILLMNQ